MLTFHYLYLALNDPTGVRVDFMIAVDGNTLVNDFDEPVVDFANLNICFDPEWSDMPLSLSVIPSFEVP